jgi:hypothetical protein
MLSIHKDRNLQVTNLSSYREDEDFRRCVRKFMVQRFRLMDLPAEIRLLIAEYALSYESITWTWACCYPGEKAGKFLCNARRDDGEYRIGDSYSLSLFCKQLAYETRNLMYKINTLEFNGDERFNHTPPDIPGYSLLKFADQMDDDPDNHLSNVVTAWELFRTSCPASVFAAVRNVRLRFDSDFFMRELDYGHHGHLDRLMSVAAQSPHIVFEFYPGWNTPDFLECEERRKESGGPYFKFDFETFLREGEELDEIVRVLSEAPYNVALAARTWRYKVSRKPTYTDLSEMKKIFPRWCTVTGYEIKWGDVERWIEHGI